MQKDSRMESLAEKHRRILLGSTSWKNRPISIGDLTGGITNKNYLVRSGFAEYVARFAFPSNKLLGLDREREIFNTARAAQMGLGPEVVRHVPKYGLLIVRYIAGNVFADGGEEWTDDTIASVARLLRKLHNGGARFKGERKVFRDVETYVARAERLRGWIPEDIQVYLQRLRAVEQKLGDTLQTACHFDVMLGNIVKTPTGELKLIDWEYSANGDPRFDVSMFALKASLNRIEEHTLLDAYNEGNTDTDITFSELQLMKMVVCMREASWGMLQSVISEMKGEFDYVQYAKEHMRRFDEIRNGEVGV